MVSSGVLFIAFGSLDIKGTEFISDSEIEDKKRGVLHQATLRKGQREADRLSDEMDTAIAMAREVAKFIERDVWVLDKFHSLAPGYKSINAKKRLYFEMLIHYHIRDLVIHAPVAFIPLELGSKEAILEYYIRKFIKNEKELIDSIFNEKE